jgi:hypothetical protein
MIDLTDKPSSELYIRVVESEHLYAQFYKINDPDSAIKMLQRLTKLFKTTYRQRTEFLSGCRTHLQRQPIFRD